MKAGADIRTREEIMSIRSVVENGEVYLNANDLCESFDLMASVATIVKHPGIAKTLEVVSEKLRKNCRELLTDSR